MATLSTHVLDTAAGRPAPGVPVTLLDAADAVLAEASTDADGRVGSLGGELTPGTYRLRFGVDGPFYPEIVVAFRIVADEHHHVPLLLSPFGYSTYRGS
ncbi:hydroxyisourate hydrolase [Ornithinimicrobium ciconiae]|uniref:5-hydroxyisourate hydrolase n=1 Tax=Ornithinimicrobium ciconiae TaxID=2594265 RepID=A0A516G6M2_9MICO|nr:hydroxyisourate hydrolase [Ornithinimicrobium ciconiae]QDO87163.1 hydroxyisourate hydrolase [Ornithinimicrobium ciconiae]